MDAKLNSAELYGAIFTGARLAGTDFTGCALANADFTGAELDDAIIDTVDSAEVKALLKP